MPGQWQVLFDGGQFALVKVIDLARPGELDRLRQELDGA
jgi:hypothetical protein